MRDACYSGFGEKSVNNLFEAIEQKRKIPLSRLLFSLGIRHLGETGSALLANHYGTWDRFENAMTAAQISIGPEWDELTSIILLISTTATLSMTVCGSGLD